MICRLKCSIQFFASFPNQKEANVYIENIRKKFGSFHHAPLKSAIEPNLLAEYTVQMIPGTGISRTIDPNATYTNEESTEVSSSSNITISGSATTTTGNTSTNDTSLATTMDLSLSENANGSHSFDAVEIGIEDQQPSKKARLSDAADSNEYNRFAQTIMVTNDQNADTATISPVLFEQLHKANLCFEQEMKQMSEQMAKLSEKLNELTIENERLKHETQVLGSENSDLKKRLDEKVTELANVEAASQQQTEQHESQQVDRAAAIALAKTMKICMGCDSERPLDMLHFCGVACQKLYL